MAREAALHWCQLLRSNKRRDDAKECIMRCLDIYPNHGALLNELGLLSLIDGSTEEGKHRNIILSLVTSVAEHYVKAMIINIVVFYSK